MSDEAHELLKSDLMRMADLIVILEHVIPPISVVSDKAAKCMFRGNTKEVRQMAEEHITETLDIARTIHARIKAATDPRVSLVKCVGVFRDGSGTGLYHAVVLCTEEEFDQGDHYDLVRAHAEEEEGYDVVTGDPVVDELDDAFGGFTPFDWSSISPRDWLVSEKVKAIFLIS